MPVNIHLRVVGNSVAKFEILLRQNVCLHYCILNARHYSYSQKSQSLSLSTVQEKPAQKRRLNVGVFGAGRIASSVHIPNILSDRRYNINWVIEEDEERAHKVKDQLYLQDTPFLKFKDRQSLLADKGY